MCKALAAKNMELAKYEFADPQLLSEDELIEIYSQQAMLTDWVNSVAEYLLDEAIKGKAWKGYKIVEGRSIRKWSDEKKVLATLLENGFKTEQVTTLNLMPITGVEKLFDKKHFAELINPLIIKPQGKPTLVPQSDKREAFGINQAKADFSE
jgi:Protein of unknown function (DUF2800)